MKHCIVLGTRPEIIKLAPLIRELQKQNSDFFIVHTNQHYSEELDKVFFDELELPRAKYNLSIGSGTHGEQTARMLAAIEKVFRIETPTHVYVQGDTNTVIAAVLAGAKEFNLKIVHIEAGLRSYDRTMPEEINRIIADHLSDFLFVPSETQKNILLNEGIPARKIFVVGNTIVDSVYQHLPIAEKRSTVLDRLQVSPQAYILVTLHRPANVDQENILTTILAGLEALSLRHQLPLVFPCHPRTRKKIDDTGTVLSSRIHLIDPVGYFDMLHLLRHARLVATDSGGLQEEACILQVPCITLRQNTERPETIEVGGNMLAGQAGTSIIEAATTMLNRTIHWRNPFGDGHTAEKILHVIATYNADERN